MSTLDRALRSLKLIKFASGQTPFYWLSFLDPEADAYTAIDQEIRDRKQDLYNASGTDAAGNQIYNIKGKPILKADADNAIAAAFDANDAAALKRRTEMYPVFMRGAGIGAGVGGVGGAGLGYWGAGKLGFGLKGRALSALGMGTAGALLGGALGGNIAGNAYINRRSTTFENGNEALAQLNNALNAGLDAQGFEATTTNPHPDFVNINAGNEARKKAKDRGK